MGLEAEDRRAAAHLLRFCSPELQGDVVGLCDSGRPIWDEPDSRHKVWLQSQAPLWERQLRELTPGAAEPVAFYLRRAHAIARRIEEGGRSQPRPTLVDDALRGFETARPL